MEAEERRGQVVIERTMMEGHRRVNCGRREEERSGYNGNPLVPGTCTVHFCFTLFT